MERLQHDHIVKLIGTYSVRRNELYLLIWPVAVCDLSCLLEEIEALRTNPEDRDDTLQRFKDLNLRSPGSTRSTRGVAEDGEIDSSQYLQQIMGCISQAICYCHSERIRHLDLKPHNILLGPERVYLADFGIARDVDGRDHTHTLGGPATPKWVAPERNNLEDEWSMKAADVYSLGLVFLDIATILYGAKLSEFDQVLGDSSAQSLASRPTRLQKYHEKLSAMALASQQVADPHARTFGPKHILSLTSRMLSRDPKVRPEAHQVNAELVELGGLNQMYHFPCCKKDSRFLSRLIDTRHKVLADENRQLQETNQRMSKRLVELEGKDETYQMRLDNELRRLGERHAKERANLQSRLDAEQEKRKQLEAQLADTQRAGGCIRRPVMVASERSHGPACDDGLTMRPARPLGMAPPTTPRGMRHFVAKTLGMTDSLQAPPPAVRRPSEGNKSMAPVTFARAAAVAVGPSSPNPNAGNFPLRSRNSGSKLPVSVNPSTPIRSRSNTPRLNRDPSLTDSTQNSMSSSMFSRLSGGTKESVSEAASPAAGGSPLMNRDKPVSKESANENGNLMASGAGLAISHPSSFDGRTDDATYSHSERAPDTASVKSSGPREAPSPMPSGSTFSSPRTTKAEMDMQSSTAVRIPSMPTAKSWAEVARRERKVQV